MVRRSCRSIPQPPLLPPRSLTFVVIDRCEGCLRVLVSSISRASLSFLVHVARAESGAATAGLEIVIAVCARVFGLQRGQRIAVRLVLLVELLTRTLL